jgi:hypothetical protein
MSSQKFRLMTNGIFGSAHLHSYRQQLAGHKADVTHAVERMGPVDAAKKLAPVLPKRAIDAKYLRQAFDALTRTDGRGAGPNRISPKELEGQEIWNLCHATRDLVINGWYSPGPTRTEQIPKKARGLSKATMREIQLQNIEDKLLDRTAKDVYGPVLENLLLETTFGSRSTSSWEDALGYAKAYSENCGAVWWVQNDIQAAFDNVDTRKLFDALEDILEDEAAVDHIRLLVDRGQQRGILTGSPLSPLLLDVFLHTVLDTPWRANSRTPPLIRLVDDLLIPCQSRSQADEVFDRLESVLSQHDLVLKYPRSKSVLDISNISCEWLGASATLKRGRVVFSLTDEKRVGIDTGCTQPNDQLKRTEVLGILESLGCCYSQDLEEWLLDLIAQRNQLQPGRWRVTQAEARKNLHRSARRWQKTLDTAMGKMTIPQVDVGIDLIKTSNE